MEGYQNIISVVLSSIFLSHLFEWILMLGLAETIKVVNCINTLLLLLPWSLLYFISIEYYAPDVCKISFEHYPDFPACRFVTAVMMFFACFINYMLRVNMSVNIIAMVPHKDEPSGSNMTRVYRVYKSSYHELAYVKEEDGRVTFKWTAQQEAYVLSGYFWGYCITCFVGGLVAEYYGPKKVIMLTMFLCGCMTFLCPVSATLHHGALVAVRILCGAAGGFLYPSLHALVARWAPPAEKGKFVSALLGGAIGTVCTWSLSGPLIEAYGWETEFYVTGAIAVLWCIVWWYLVFDSPMVHPRITAEEKEYIINALGQKVNQGKKKSVPPLKSIFTSSPFLAMIILQYGNLWGLYFVMTAGPKFVSSCLKFTLTKTGFLSSLPYLARMFCSLGFGSLGDMIMRKKLMPVVVIRKFFTLFSHIIPGLFLILLGYWTSSPYISVALITLSMGSNGAATLTNLVNHQDLAPNYAGTLYGIATGIGNTAGFITPIVTAHFTQHGNGFNEWRPVFLVGASLYIGAAVYFIIFGTAKTQKWNYHGQPQKT